MAKVKDIQKEINEFLEVWDIDELISFLKHVIPLFELYDVEDDNDWVKNEVGGDEENIINIRTVCMIYIVSRIAEFHAGKLCSLNVKFKNLWQRMETTMQEMKDDTTK